MTSWIKDIGKRVVAVIVVLTIVSCEVNDLCVDIPEQNGPNPFLPNNGIDISPKKSIPIKRKKPTILNPSPRPLSTGYIAEIEEKNEYKEYE